MKEYNYIILGTGPAGYKLAKLLSKTKKSLLAVEGGLFGGTCPNVGCEPKIFLEGTVHAAMLTRQLLGRGIEQPALINWDVLMKTKKARFDSWPNETRDIYYKMCDVAEGYAKFVDSHVIEVNGKQFYGEKIIIATGHRPHRLTIPGHEFTHDSSDVLSMDYLPDKVVVIGGGYVGMELATFMAAAGAQVEILVRSDRVLRNFYSKYTVKLVELMEQRDIKIHFFTQAKLIEKKDKNLEITTNNGDKIDCDYILDATGRIPNLDLNLDIAGIGYDERGIDISDTLQTSDPGVYAIGDITNQRLPKLTTVGEYEARFLFDLLEKDQNKKFKMPTIGTCAFTYPQIAQVGVNPDSIIDNADYKIEERNLSCSSLSAGENEKEARLTLVYNKNEKLVGACEISANAANDINNLVAMIGLGISKKDYNENVVPIYPALADKVGSLLGK